MLDGLQLLSEEELPLILGDFLLKRDSQVSLMQKLGLDLSGDLLLKLCQLQLFLQQLQRIPLLPSWL